MQIKNIVIYVVDCLRPDFLGCYGFDKPTSPNIDKIAKDGVVFKNAYTSGTWTKPVAAPLLTGIHPSCLGMQNQELAFRGFQSLLQKVVKQAGFKTYAFSSNPYFSKSFGFTEGFDAEYNLDFLEPLYRKNLANKEIASNIYQKVSSIVPSQYLHELFYQTLEPLNNNFVVFWSMDPHDPYCIRGSKSYFGNSLSDFVEGETYFLKNNLLATRFQKFLRLILFNLFGYHDKKRIEKMKSLYCETIRYNDEKIGELVEHLKKKGIYENTLFILLGDHGESFVEHGEYGHCSTPYNEVIKIPLIIKFPGQKYAGREISENVSILDIYPTILEGLGLNINSQELDGQSLMNYLNGNLKQDNERKIFIECLHKTDLYSGVLIKNDQKYLRLELRGDWLRRMARKISFFPRWFKEKQFDLKKDPEEQRGDKKVSPQLKDEFEEMRGNYQDRARNYQSYRKEMVSNEKVIERLKNLGYF